MILIIAVVLLVLWLLGFLAFHVTAFAIHLLLIAAVIAVIAHFTVGRRSGRRTRLGPTVRRGARAASRSRAPGVGAAAGRVSACDR
jgi:hypothetical protein